MLKLQQHSYICAPAPFQWAALAALDVSTQPQIESYRRKRGIVLDMLSKKFELASPLSDPERSGIVVVRLPAGRSAMTVSQQLIKEDHILVSPLEDPRNLRLSVHFFNTWKEFETLMSQLNHYC
jgi:aspartate aminotransferase/aminotransferase